MPKPDLTPEERAAMAKLAQRRRDEAQRRAVNAKWHEDDRQRRGLPPKRRGQPEDLYGSTMVQRVLKQLEAGVDNDSNAGDGGEDAA